MSTRSGFTSACVAGAMLAALVSVPASAEEEAPSPYSGLYFVASLSLGAPEDVRADAGYVADHGYLYEGSLGAGYAFGPLRTETVLMVQRNYLFDIDPSPGSGIPSVQYGGWLDLGGVMANAFLDIDISPRFRPYVGAGIGYGYVEAVYSESDCVFACALGADLVDSNDTMAMWQAMAGVSFVPPRAEEGIELYLGYRYFRTDNMNFTLVGGTPFEQEGLRSHIFDFGVRLRFP